MPNPNRLSSPALATLLLTLAILAGCNPFRRGEKLADCHRPQSYAAAENLPGLQIPVGLDAPNTRAAMSIPQLSEPEAPFQPGDPCLDEPPRFSNSARLEPLPRDSREPAPAPAPQAPATPADSAPAPRAPAAR